MNRTIPIWFFICLLFYQGFTLRGICEENINFGVGVKNITPPVGSRRAGNFYEIISTGVHDSLFAKALVFEQGKVKGALVSCDLTSVDLYISQRARRIISEKTGIPVSNILIAATHTHTAPLYHSVRVDIFHKNAIENFGGEDPNNLENYKDKLITGIVESVVDAKNNLRPLQLKTGITWQTGLSFYRRFYLKSGSESLRHPGSSVRMNPGRKNPDIIRPAGRIDPEVGIILMSDPTTQLPAISLVNFALHLDTRGGTEFSADYPFYLEKYLQSEFGEQFTSFFVTGACGNINHINVDDDHRLTTEEIGTALFQTVLKELKWLEPVGQPLLGITSKTIQIPFQRFTREQIKKAHLDIHKMGTKDIPWLDQVQAYSIVSIESRKSQNLAVEIQALRFSENVALVGLPGELFVELGLAIKKASPFKTTLVLELCNDSPGYIPTKEGFDQGDYEIVNSRIEKGGGEKMVEIAVILLNELYKTAIGKKKNIY
jgi:neutral ceramidase